MNASAGIRSNSKDWAAVLLLLAVATGAGLLLEAYVSLTSQAMIYVLAVVIASYRLDWLKSAVFTVGAVTALTFFIVRHGWGYPLPVALGATGVFVLFDAMLVASCSLKFVEGGWFPLVTGALIFAVMATWRRGRELLIEHIQRGDPELLPVIRSLTTEKMQRVSRTAVYAVANPDTVPQALMHNLKHNQVLHERNLILTVAFHDVPWIAFEDRVEVTPLAPGFWRVQINYGFINQPDIPKALELCQSHGLPINLFETSYFLSREIVVPTRGAGMARWREALFALMSRNAGSVADFFRLPNNCVIELGTRVQI